jgi:hypothetical protein
MDAGIQSVHSFRSCRGRALVVAAPAAGDDGRLALASTLAEHEGAGDPVRTVVLRLARRDDAAWAAGAAAWLVDHGRRALVRTPVVLPRELVALARRWGLTVMLELAHAEGAMQRALVGPSSDAAAALLFHAQHLRQMGVEVAAHFGPLLPTIHDRPDVVDPLVRHVAAADLVDAHLSAGRLTSTRFDALAEHLAWAEMIALARGFDLDPRDDLPARLVHGPPGLGAAGGLRVPRRTRQALLGAVRRSAEAAGLRLDHCGCPAQCHLDPERTPAFVGVLPQPLFGT